MAPMGDLGAWGTLIHEKNLKSKIWCQTPFKRLQIRAQATLASGIGSLESIPGLLKCLQIWAQATLDSRIGSLESIPGLLKCLKIQAQARYIG